MHISKMDADNTATEEVLPDSTLSGSFASIGSCGLDFRMAMVKLNDYLQEEAGPKASSVGDVWQWMHGQVQRIGSTEQSSTDNVNDVMNESRRADPQEQQLRRRIRDRVSEILSVYVDTSSHNPFDGHQLAASE